MNPSTDSAMAEKPAPRMFLELALVIGLPALSIFIGCALAIVSYTHGFTDIAQAVVHAPR
jgi:hypothetical protein